MDLLGTASRPKGPPSSAPQRERQIDLSQNGYSLSLSIFLCRSIRPTHPRSVKKQLLIAANEPLTF